MAMVGGMAQLHWTRLARGAHANWPQVQLKASNFALSVNTYIRPPAITGAM